MIVFIGTIINKPDEIPFESVRSVDGLTEVVVCNRLLCVNRSDAWRLLRAVRGCHVQMCVVCVCVNRREMTKTQLTTVKRNVRGV